MSIFSRLFNKGQEPEKSGEQTPGTPPAAPAAPAAPTPDAGRVAPVPSSVGAVPVLAGGDDEEPDVPTTQQERPDLVEQTATPRETPRPKAPSLQQPATSPELRPSAARTPAAPKSRPARVEPPKSAASRVAPAAPVKRPSVPPPLPPAAPPSRRGPSRRPVANVGALLSRSAADAPRVETPEPGTNTRSDMTDVQALFNDLAANYMMPVRDFMFEVRSGKARADWLHTYDAAIKSLRRAAEGLELPDLARELDAFAEVLARAGNATGPVIGGGARDDLLRVYDKLVALMPTAFSLDAEHSRRETIILNALLLQVPGVERATLDRLYAAGLNSLERFLVADPAELAVVAGISLEVAAALTAKVQARKGDIARGSLSSLPPPPAPVGPGAPPMPGVRGHRFAWSESSDGESGSIDVQVGPPESTRGLAETPRAGTPAAPAALAKPPAPSPPAPPVAAPPKLPPAETKALRPLVEVLRGEHTKMQALADQWGDDAAADRRAHRKSRAEVVDKIVKLLEAAGEKPAAAELAKLPFEQKLAFVERYVKP